MSYKPIMAVAEFGLFYWVAWVLMKCALIIQSHDNEPWGFDCVAALASLLMLIMGVRRLNPIWTAVGEWISRK